jgi:hypothetical protein
VGCSVAGFVSHSDQNVEAPIGKNQLELWPYFCCYLQVCGDDTSTQLSQFCTLSIGLSFILRHEVSETRFWCPAPGSEDERLALSTGLRFRLKMETESSLRNVVFLNKGQEDG